MNLEQLTKHQIVLLTLLVSFVTSIATGIVTVSLMNQAPPGITRTINQIVEHTVEQVVPSVSTGGTTEKTIVVKNDDLAAQSIASVQKALVRIVAKGGSDLIARGVILDARGVALSDQAALDASGAGSFEAILFSGERVPLTVRPASTSSPIAVLDIKVGTSTGFAPAGLGDPSKLQLGESVIRIGGVGRDTVGEGIISSLPTAGMPEVEASVTASTPGSVIMTLFGEIVGLSTTDSQTLGPDFYSLLSAPSNSTTTNSSS